MRWDVTQGMFRVYEGGGGGQQSGTTNTTQNFSPEEAAQRAKVQEEAARIYAQSAGTIQASPYPGAAPVPFSPETVQAQQMLSQYATGAGAQQAQQAGGYSQFLMGPAQYAESNPYLQSAMGAAVRPITQAYTDPGGVMSQIRTGSQQAGQYGGTRQGVAEGVAARGYLTAIGDTTSKMANENYQQAQKLGAQALFNAPQTYQMGAQTAIDLSNVGLQKESLAQSMEDYAAQQRAWNLNAPWTPLQNYASIVFGGASPGTTSTSTTSGGGGSRTASRLSGAASGAAMGTAIMPGWGTAIGAALGALMG